MNELQQHFLEYGYQVHRTLERGGETHRNAYLAVFLETQQPIIIEEFGKQKYAGEVEKENQKLIQALLEIIHPRIGRFLGVFETPDSICLVQEYKKAIPLSNAKEITSDRLKEIASEVLDILIDLQNETPALVHRNIRPENIWIDSQNRIYLVGFELNRESQNTTLAYTGIPNVFRPREQIANRSLNKSTDLYALGVTIISLLTQTGSTKLHKFISTTGDINFRQYVPEDVSLHFINWLEKLTHSKAIERYSDADEAFKALNGIDTQRQPEVKLDATEFYLEAKFLGENLIDTVKINNFVPETTLKGYWEIQPNPGDNKTSSSFNKWIKIKPGKFTGNRIKCEINVDTGKLMASQIYERQLLLKTNSNQETQTVKLVVSTPSLQFSKPPYTSIAIIIATAIACIGVTTFMIPVSDTWGILGIVLGILAGLINGSFIGWNDTEMFKFSSRATLILSLVITVIGFLSNFEIVGGFLGGSTAGFIIGFVAGTVLRNHLAQNFSTLFAQFLAFLAVLLGGGLGVSLHKGLLNPLAILPAISGGLSLLAVILWLLNKNRKVLAQYNKLKPSLVKP